MGRRPRALRQGRSQPRRGSPEGRWGSPEPRREVRNVDGELPKPGEGVANPGAEVGNRGGDISEVEVDPANHDLDVARVPLDRQSPGGAVGTALPARSSGSGWAPTRCRRMAGNAGAGHHRHSAERRRPDWPPRLRSGNTPGRHRRPCVVRVGFGRLLVTQSGPRWPYPPVRKRAPTSRAIGVCAHCSRAHSFPDHLMNARISLP